MDRLLVTTALEGTWGQGQPVLFLGEWCRLYSRRDVWSKMDAEVLSHHWNDRKKLKRDHDALKLLYERVLSALRIKLNQVHGVNKSLRYWRIILGPWLITYLPILFDRWEVLRLAFQRQETYKNYEIPVYQGAVIAQDFNEFSEFRQTDYWNYQVFLRILKFQYKQNTEFLTGYPFAPIAEESKSIVTSKGPKTSILKWKLVRPIDSILSYMAKWNTGVFFYQSYFKFTQLFRINLSMHQVPSLFRGVFNKQIKANPDQQLRNVYIDFDPVSDFERFVSIVLMQDIPIAYLEAYQGIVKETERIRLDPKIIVTANAHWGDEMFKIWTAAKIASGVKFVVTDHGGSLPPLFDFFNHDEDIVDHKVTWFSASHPNQVQLPPAKLTGFEIESSRQYCSVIGMEMPRYSYRATAYPVVEQTLQCLENTLLFCNSLKPEVFERLKVKPYPNRGWETEKRFIDRLGKDKVYAEPNYYKVLGYSKLVVCTYADTTFSEAMASGLPTILLHYPEFYEKVPGAGYLIEVLMEANIIFDNPIKAANHVNAVWDRASHWWAEPRVVQARELFFRMACNIRGNSNQAWAKFLRHLNEQVPAEPPKCEKYTQKHAQ